MEDLPEQRWQRRLVILAAVVVVLMTVLSGVFFVVRWRGKRHPHPVVRCWLVLAAGSGWYVLRARHAVRRFG